MLSGAPALPICAQDATSPQMTAISQIAWTATALSRAWSKDRGSLLRAARMILCENGPCRKVFRDYSFGSKYCRRAPFL